jgi:hypothetical protein
LTQNPLAETRDEVSGNDDEANTVKRRDMNGGKRELWPLEEDKNGQAIVPIFEKAVRLGELKDIIRAMFTHAYSKCFTILFTALTNSTILYRAIL